MTTTQVWNNVNLAPGVTTSPVLQLAGQTSLSYEVTIAEGQGGGPLELDFLGEVNGVWQTYGSFACEQVPPGTGSLVVDGWLPPEATAAQATANNSGTQHIRISVTITY